MHDPAAVPPPRPGQENGAAAEKHTHLDNDGVAPERETGARDLRSILAGRPSGNGLRYGDNLANIGHHEWIELPAEFLPREAAVPGVVVEHLLIFVRPPATGVGEHPVGGFDTIERAVEPFVMRQVELPRTYNFADERVMCYGAFEPPLDQTPL